MTFLFNNSISIVNDPTTGTVDAFGRFRVSDLETLFSDVSYIDNQIFWSQDIVGVSASIDDANSLNSSELLLKVGTASGEHVFRQTRRRMIYQPGKSQMMFMTAVMDPKANVRQRLGYFTTADGIFFEHDGITMKVVIRSSSSGTVVEDVVPQASWNLDKMDGTGPSGTTIDWSKAQIWTWDIEWLGVGAVRAGVVIKGAIHYVHRFFHSNIETGTYMGHATLPFRYEIENTGVSASPTTFKQICVGVASESGQQASGLTFSTDTGTSGITVGTTISIPLISIRLNPSNLNSSLELLSTQVLNTTNAFINFKVIFNATLTDPSWVNAGQLAQVDVSATAQSGGLEIDGGYAANKANSTINDLKTRLNLGFDINNIPDTLTLAAQSIGGNATTYGSISWNEKY